MEFMKTSNDNISTEKEVKIKKDKSGIKETAEKKISAFTKFMQENQGMIEIIDMKAVMR
jgi:hypothetical protein